MAERGGSLPETGSAGEVQIKGFLMFSKYAFHYSTDSTHRQPAFSGVMKSEMRRQSPSTGLSLLVNVNGFCIHKFIDEMHIGQHLSTGKQYYFCV